MGLPQFSVTSDSIYAIQNCVEYFHLIVEIMGYSILIMNLSSVFVHKIMAVDVIQSTYRQLNF